jgi:hypothetical protein
VDIANELDRDRLVSFNIDASEPALSLANQPKLPKNSHLSKRQTQSFMETRSALIVSMNLPSKSA